MVRSFLLSLARAPTRVRTLPAASFPPTIFARGRAERPFLPGLARALATPRATTALSIATWSQQLAARTPQGCCSSRRAASVEAERPLQVLPSEEFWGEVYDSLRDDGEAEGVTILTWHKRAREPVAVGETILEVDVAGVVLEMKASVAGFMGSRGAEEGAVVRPGEHAAEILREAEPEPVVSDATMSIEITNSEGKPPKCVHPRVRMYARHTSYSNQDTNERAHAQAASPLCRGRSRVLRTSARPPGKISSRHAIWRRSMVLPMARGPPSSHGCPEGQLVKLACTPCLGACTT